MKLIRHLCRKECTMIADRISLLEEKLLQLDEMIEVAKESGDEDALIDLSIDRNEVLEQINFAWQDDEQAYYDALEEQRFEPDGTLIGYPC